jgi:hypothetical protein
MGTYAPSLVIVLSVFLMIVLAYRSFIHEQLSFNGSLIAPRLLANIFTLSCGFLLYLIIILFSYAIITFYWGPLSAVVSPYTAGTPIGKLIGSGNGAGGAISPLASSPILPLVVACLAAWVLTWDAAYNPFAVILKFVHDLVRIPDKANATVQQLRAADFNQLPPDAALVIARNTDIVACDPADFARDHRDLLYRWAHLCHLRFLLLKYKRVGSSGAHIAIRRRGAYILTALDWEKVGASYHGLAPRIQHWRETDSKDPIDTIEIYSAVAELIEQHCRVLACVIVCVSRNERELWERIEKLTDAVAETTPGNLVQYLAMFCANLFVSLFIGRELSILFYHKFISNTDQIVSLDADKLKYWFFFSLILFFTPIALMFAFRRLAHDWFPFKIRRYWGVYAIFGVVAFSLAVLVLPELSITQTHPPLFSPEYWSRVGEKLYWGFTPCLLTGIVAYRMTVRRVARIDQKK